MDRRRQETAGQVFDLSPVSGWSAGADGPLARAYTRLLASGDIRVNGRRPWDLIVHDRRFFRRLVLSPSVGLGESYVEGWWDTPRLDEFFAHLIAAHIDRRAVNFRRAIAIAQSFVMNLQDLARAREVARVHYDLGNDFYRAMLGERMVYTSAYWRDAQTLDTAQEAKLELVCQKLELQPGMRVLDIGCGWGSFAHYAAERHGVSVVGVTISRSQVELAAERCRGLPVEIRLQDYRVVDGHFDRIVSLGMFEHVGHRNYRTYMDRVRRCLRPGGIFLLQTIGLDQTSAGIDPWVTKYIFPNSEIPSLARLADAIRGHLILEDLHNFGPDYDRTLMAWYHNFEAAWPSLRAGYPPGFYRLWKYYLLMFAGIFRARGLQLWQLVLVPPDTLRPYHRPLL